MIRIGFGGGCHWCTEAVFQSLCGIHDVAQGFVAADPPDDSLSEAVVVAFEPAEVALRTLMAAHLATHASTADHKMRGKYRSAIYTFDAAQMVEARGILTDIAAETGNTFVTRILRHRLFKPSDERFHNYYAADPERPFCKTYIDPKLARLRREFAAQMKVTNRC